MASEYNTIDRTPTPRGNAAGGLAATDFDREHTERVVQEFLAARVGSSAATPALDDMAAGIASALLSHAPDDNTANMLRKHFALVLTWKIRAEINEEEPDEDGEYGGFDAVREAARAALSGSTITAVDGSKLI
jgi:hypothetical protein